MLRKVRSFDVSSGVLSRPTEGALESGVDVPDLSREAGLDVAGVTLAETALEDAGDMVLRNIKGKPVDCALNTKNRKTSEGQKTRKRAIDAARRRVILRNKSS